MKTLSKVLSVLAVLSFLLLCFGSIVGCAHTAQGLARENALSASATNAVDFIAHYVAPMVPQPWQGLVPLAVGAAGAALGAWNLSQEKRLATLANKAPPKA